MRNIDLIGYACGLQKRFNQKKKNYIYTRKLMWHADQSQRILMGFWRIIDITGGKWTVRWKRFLFCHLILYICNQLFTSTSKQFQYIYIFLPWVSLFSTCLEAFFVCIYIHWSWTRMIHMIKNLRKGFENDWSNLCSHKKLISNNFWKKLASSKGSYSSMFSKRASRSQYRNKFHFLVKAGRKILEN